ncbi:MULTISPECIES: hypothetical protein [Streptomyces]|uniref:RHS repeat protein n=1 Tax=Streptomyces viridochromogenes TaxID=1938 RepID=A0A0L8K9N5_STRVR|nr:MULTISPECIES: hypothetical protein [Streptomyces]KOG22581.1 hypothetical protein ADK34_21850 [Streptomyces viridochromogenes]
MSKAARRIRTPAPGGRSGPSSGTEFGDTSYTYGSTAVEAIDGKSATTVTRRYDHLHRMVLEETTAADTVGRVVNRYLPPPANEVSTTITWTSGTSTKSQETSRRFDSHGNVLEDRTPDTRTEYTYYPADADGFTRLKDTTVHSLSSGEVIPASTPSSGLTDPDSGPITIR